MKETFGFEAETPKPNEGGRKNDSSLENFSRQDQESNGEIEMSQR